MNPQELAQLLDEAAEKGAKRALESIGLDYPGAADDVRELKGLLGALREVRSGALRFLGKLLTLAILGLLLLFAGKQYPWGQ